jgi:hypothetical protein
LERGAALIYLRADAIKENRGYSDTELERLGPVWAGGKWIRRDLFAIAVDRERSVESDDPSSCRPTPTETFSHIGMGDEMRVAIQ